MCNQPAFWNEEAFQGGNNWGLHLCQVFDQSLLENQQKQYRLIARNLPPASSQWSQQSRWRHLQEAVQTLESENRQRRKAETRFRYNNDSEIDDDCQSAEDLMRTSLESLVRREWNAIPEQCTRRLSWVIWPFGNHRNRKIDEVKLQTGFNRRTLWTGPLLWTLHRIQEVTAGVNSQREKPEQQMDSSEWWNDQRNRLVVSSEQETRGLHAFLPARSMT